MFAYWIGEHQQGSTISNLYESRHDEDECDRWDRVQIEEWQVMVMVSVLSDKITLKNARARIKVDAYLWVMVEN